MDNRVISTVSDGSQHIFKQRNKKNSWRGTEYIKLAPHKLFYETILSYYVSFIPTFLDVFRLNFVYLTQSCNVVTCFSTSSKL